MTTSKVRRAIAAALCLACLILVVIGGINMPKKDKAAGQTILNDLRAQALLNATGEGVVESYVNIAKKQAQEKAKVEKASMAQIREAVAKAEEDTRAKYENSELSAAVAATPELLAAVESYNAQLSNLGIIEAAAKQAYIDAHYEEALAEMLKQLLLHLLRIRFLQYTFPDILRRPFHEIPVFSRRMYAE